MPPPTDDLDDLQPPQATESLVRPPSNSGHKKTGHRSSKVWLLAAIFVLLLIGCGLFWWSKHHQTSPKHNVASKSQVHPTVKSNSSSQTIKYTSNGQDLNLSFSYPSDWSVTPPSNDNASDQTITVSSPLVSVTNSSGATITGKAVVSIRPGSAQINELTSGKAIASQNSIQIGYTQPTTSQQQYPYLTFIDLSGGSDPSGAFDEVLITGQDEFSQSESVTAETLGGALDPIISASFYTCTTEACSGSSQTPLNITYDTWQNSSLFEQVLAILDSLQLN